MTDPLLKTKYFQIFRKRNACGKQDLFLFHWQVLPVCGRCRCGRCNGQWPGGYGQGGIPMAPQFMPQPPPQQGPRPISIATAAGIEPTVPAAPAASLQASGYDWEADPKHVQILLEELGLTECKPVGLPMAKSSESHDEME